MTIAAVVVFCVLLLILAFLAPRLSRHPERGGQKVLGVGSRGAGKAPGKLGRWLQKPFQHVAEGRVQERQRRAPRTRQDAALGLLPALRRPRAGGVVGAHVIERR